jgi:hypothetical protein
MSSEDSCRRNKDGYCWKCQAGNVDRCPRTAAYREALNRFIDNIRLTAPPRIPRLP